MRFIAVAPDSFDFDWAGRSRDSLKSGLIFVTAKQQVTAFFWLAAQLSSCAKVLDNGYHFLTIAASGCRHEFLKELWAVLKSGADRRETLALIPWRFRNAH